MLAAVFQRPGQMEVTEVDTPEIGVDEVLVKVGANTICGTDVRIFRGEKTRGIHPPTILGHEMGHKPWEWPRHDLSHLTRKELNTLYQKLEVHSRNQLMALMR